MEEVILGSCIGAAVIFLTVRYWKKLRRGPCSGGGCGCGPRRKPKPSRPA